MPSATARRRERQVIDEAVRALRVCAPGLSVSVAGRPEDEQGTGLWPTDLTVEAVLRLERNGEAVQWAADVVTLTWDNLLRPAVAGVEESLRLQLTQLAKAYDRYVVVGFNPPRRHKDKGAAYVADIVAHVEALLAGTADQDFGPFASDPNTYIEVGEEPSIGDSGECVHLTYVLSDSAATWEQLDTLATAVRAKLKGQLKRAHDLGYPTMLIVDAVGAADLFGGGNFLAGTTTISQRLSREVISHAHEGGTHSLDFACLMRQDEASPVFGYWPQNPKP